MCRAWSTFAYTGNPGWDPFTPEGLQTMVFDTASTQQRYPHERTLQAYRKQLPEVLGLV
jgi:carboxylesterase type B